MIADIFELLFTETSIVLIFITFIGTFLGGCLLFLTILPELRKLAKTASGSKSRDPV